MNPNEKNEMKEMDKTMIPFLIFCSSGDEIFIFYFLYARPKGSNIMFLPLGPGQIVFTAPGHNRVRPKDDRNKSVLQ